jgi:hypothetical protein
MFQYHEYPSSLSLRDFYSAIQLTHIKDDILKNGQSIQSELNSDYRTVN